MTARTIVQRLLALGLVGALGLLPRTGGAAEPFTIDVILPQTGAAAYVRLRAQAMLPAFARRKLDFACKGPAAVSVAMVTRDNFAAAMASLMRERGTSIREVALQV